MRTRRRLTRACGLAGALLAFQAGAAAPGVSAPGFARRDRVSEALRRIDAASMRGLPSVAPREVVRPDMIWVPDRWLPVPGEPGGVHVPGHWERRVSDREVYVPPITAVKPSTGALESVPAGIRPPADERPGP